MNKNQTCTTDDNSVTKKFYLKIFSMKIMIKHCRDQLLLAHPIHHYIHICIESHVLRCAAYNYYIYCPVYNKTTDNKCLKIKECTVHENNNYINIKL